MPVLDLPTDRPRPARRGFASAREDYVLDAELVAAIRKMGARRGVSLFATMLARFAALLSRLSSHSAVVVGISAPGCRKSDVVGDSVVVWEDLGGSQLT